MDEAVVSDAPLDSVEREYLAAIAAAERRRDTPAAYDLSIGLSEYRELFKPC